MQLKPQDIVVLLKLVAHQGDWTFRSLAGDLFMSTGEVHNALGRASKAHLYDEANRKPNLRALEEFLIHGVKYAFPAERGPIVRGTPTAYAAPPLSKIISSPANEQPPVWPHAQGDARGYSLEPLCGAVPDAAGQDQVLYELLALVDAIRDGRVRERNLAVAQLQSRLRGSNATA